MLKGGALVAKTSLNAENYVDGAPCRTMLTLFSRHVSPPHDHTILSGKFPLLSLTICRSLMVGWS